LADPTTPSLPDQRPIRNTEGQQPLDVRVMDRLA
jgi:hypothetical protein